MALVITKPKRAIEFPEFDKLPGKPSALIRLAVADIVKSEKAGMRIDMSNWLAAEIKTPKGQTKPVKSCTVCFAGAVMAQTLKDNPMSKNVLKMHGKKLNAKDLVNLFDEPTDGEVVNEVSPDYEYGKDEKPLDALNEFRQGNLEAGFIDMGIEFPRRLLKSNVAIVPYYENKTKFKAQMRELASALSKVGY